MSVDINILENQWYYPDLVIFSRQGHNMNIYNERNEIRNFTLISMSKKLEEIHQQGPMIEIPDFCDSVRNVVIIASSSRGGSSVFAEVLRKCETFLHLRAEFNPILHVSGLTYPTSLTGSDALNTEHLTPEIKPILNRELSLECGNLNLNPLSATEIDHYALAITRRLFLQWPNDSFHYDSCRRWLLSTFETLEKLYGWTRSEIRDPQLFWSIYLTHVRAEYPNINPYYYDLNPTLVERYFTDVSVPKGPPAFSSIEEPPFIIPLPLKQPTRSEISQKPFVIKTPSNVYRLGFIKALFPNATPWILHLTRNAPQSINGLYDGWCHRGFFSHSMPGKLNILDYSDRFPKWGRDWWNFDLPPGWQDYTSRSLVEVCAFQWYAAHQATSEERKINPTTNYLRIRSEDVLSQSEDMRRAIADKIGRWLGLGSIDELSSAMTRPVDPVMATEPPKRDRWIEKSDIIIPILKQRKIKEMLEELGYHQPNPPSQTIRF